MVLQVYWNSGAEAVSVYILVVFYFHPLTPCQPSPSKLPNAGLPFARCYPEGFARRLLECFEGRRGLPGHMRYKFPVNGAHTDRELFHKLPLGDAWIDACMCEVWKYLYHNRHLAIPESWTSTMASFDKELTEFVFW